MIRTFRSGCWVGLAAIGVVLAGCGGESSGASAKTFKDASVTIAEIVEVADAEAPEPQDAEPEPAPLELPVAFEGGTLALVGFDPLEGGQMVNISGPLFSPDEIRAELTFALPDLRIEGGSTECGGEIHDGPFTTDTDMITTGTILVGPWGTVDVEFTHSSTVFSSAVGPPSCDEQIGVWTGTGGDLEGSSGTIHRLRVDGWETVTISS